jgi:hypothetical protein
VRGIAQPPTAQQIEKSQDPVADSSDRERVEQWIGMAADATTLHSRTAARHEKHGFDGACHGRAASVH